MSTTTLAAALSYLTAADSKGRHRPDPSEVVAALALAEKQSKKEKRHYAYEQLIGTWQLGFVSGTRKVSPPRSGAKPVKQLGKGRFLPRWIEITITYGAQETLLSPTLLSSTPSSSTPSSSTPSSSTLSSSNPSSPDEANTNAETGNDLGAVVNRVSLGGVSFQLSGPTRYWPKPNALGFDFVYLQGRVGPVTLYDAPVRGGVARSQTFADAALKDQAFFTFFAVEPHYIAARGKGGGLALWTRVLPS